MISHQDLPVILHNEKRGLLTVEDGRLDVLQLSRDGRPPKRLLSTPLKNFLRAYLAPLKSDQQSKHPNNRRLDLHSLAQKDHSLRLVKLHVLVEPINIAEAEQWVDNIMSASYQSIKPFRKVLLLVNPVGGKGKAKSIVHETVLPILEAAGCVVDMRVTTHRLHAEEITRDIDLEYDVIATASGDGLVYEVLNGLAVRPDARKALRIPVAPIPTGSANAVCINLFGVEDTFNIPLSCLNIIKGRLLPIDLCSVLLLPSNVRRFSFLSTAIGLMVDLDIGTENLRWMGDVRFTVGFLKGLAANKSSKCRLKLKVVESDKVEMARKAREQARARKGTKVVGGGVNPLIDGVKKLDVNGGTDGSGAVDDGAAAEDDGKDDYIPDHGPIHDAKPLEPDSTWLTIESTKSKTSTKMNNASTQSLNGALSSPQNKNDWMDGQGILYFYAGMMPWVARDLMQWPVAISGDGLIDVVVQRVAPRMVMVNAINAAAEGDIYWLDEQHYYKVSAFIAENLDKANQPIFTIDGEAFPWDSFHVDVHPRIANLLSLDGEFFASKFVQKHEQKR
ncbi:hypothetical protein CI109_102914 [Kwoniella shandongensis]|uniref:DAGKc domain-containing protein n=1 Tax=Kwoniella shandongensis TaxID=1734106 RepID=A0A5M6CBS2_9TREE|nr:uncharacterized protein CI109_000102 [Kwoniella shandongensis]KAA5531262.1 hypothetical protein CI109_000102 [Kwoniella shandongensis]